MQFFASTVVLAFLAATAQAGPTPLSTSVEGVKLLTPKAVESTEVIVDGVAKTLTFYDVSDDSAAVSKRQFYINPDQNRHYDRCGSSSWTSLTSQYSASVSDCQCIVDGVNQRGGYWFARPVDGLKVSTQLISCGSCAFAVKSDNTYGTQVGDTDIRDVINDAIRRYAKDNRVGAQGDFSCNNDQEEARTTWSLIHVPN